MERRSLSVPITSLWSLPSSSSISGSHELFSSNLQRKSQVYLDKVERGVQSEHFYHQGPINTYWFKNKLEEIPNGAFAMHGLARSSLGHGKSPCFSYPRENKGDCPTFKEHSELNFQTASRESGEKLLRHLMVP